VAFKRVLANDQVQGLAGGCAPLCDRADDLAVEALGVQAPLAADHRVG